MILRLFLFLWDGQAAFSVAKMLFISLSIMENLGWLLLLLKEKFVDLMSRHHKEVLFDNNEKFQDW